MLLFAILTSGLALSRTTLDRAIADPQWLFAALGLIALIGLLEAAARRSLFTASLEGDNHLLLRILWSHRTVPLAAVYVVGRTSIWLGRGRLPVIEVQVPSHDGGKAQTIHFMPRSDDSETLLQQAVARASRRQPEPPP